MFQQGCRDLPGSLFVAVHNGMRFTLVCVEDGRYAIARNGWLLPARWRLKDFNMCFRTFMHMVGRTYKEPPPVPCQMAEDLIARQDPPPGSLTFDRAGGDAPAVGIGHDGAPAAAQ